MIKLAPQLGLEPRTPRLTAERSTIELLGNFQEDVALIGLLTIFYFSFDFFATISYNASRYRLVAGSSPARRAEISAQNSYNHSACSPIP